MKKNISHSEFSYAEGAAQSASKPKRKSRSIILVTDVLALYLNKEGKLTHKGGLAKGRMLRLNCQKVVTQDGVKYVEVKNVKHHNIYIPLSKETWKPIEASDLEAFASKIAEKNNADIQDPEVVEQAVEITVNNINKHLSRPRHKCKGLSVYESNAFDQKDDFAYAEAGDGNKSNAEGAPTTAAAATTTTDTPAAAAETPATTTPAATTAKKSGSILLPSTVALLAGGGTFWTLNKYYSKIGDVKIYGATILAAFFGIAITEHFSKK